MITKKAILLALLLQIYVMNVDSKSVRPHTFDYSKSEFILDGKPFQIISGEMHYARIPREYWRHRIQMAKAMGCNTIATYVFWNYHEIEKDKFDFSTSNRDLASFAKIVQEEGMWLILRPGPYVCAEWDLGGLPAYLLKNPDTKLRCMDATYIQAVEKYITAISNVIKPLLITNGGSIIMLQIENEYGSYGNDRIYMEKLRQLWIDKGINISFYTSDGATPHMLESGTLPNCAIGLDPGSNQECFDVATKVNPNVPIFSAESYPGWLTHWGENWAKPDSNLILKEIKFLMDNKKSFNFYLIHGGTNFGFTAGANSMNKGYEADLTSYDYDAPINEQGQATPKYYALKRLIGSYLPKGKRLADAPKPIKLIKIPRTEMKAFTSIWDNLPVPVRAVQPTSFEANDQNQGFILYRTKLIGHKGGSLKVTEIHDYATVFLNGNYIGKLDRRKGINTIEIPKSNTEFPILDILVEGMGHINFGAEIIDRKGITERVTLNGMTLMNWELYKFPMSDSFVSSLSNSTAKNRVPGLFFKANFKLNDLGDAYVDLSKFQKGVVWVNGHNLGRYWNIGPQFKLYCPASWLLTGDNEIIVFDLHQTESEFIE